MNYMHCTRTHRAALFALLLASTSGCGSRASTEAKSKAMANADTAETLAPFVAPEPTAALAKGPPRDVGTVRHAYCQARVSITNDVARTVVTDVFVNDSETSTALTYRFPLPNDATVAGLADYRDGQRMEATIGGREEARKKLDEAAAKGESAGLAEADGAMGFRMALTPLTPHETRRVELTYVQSLHALGGERTFVYPAGYSGSVPAGIFELDLALTATTPLASVADVSPVDARFAQTSKLRARGAVERVGAPLEHDFVARWSESTEPVELAVRAVPGSALSNAGAGADAGAVEPGFVEARFAFTRDPKPEAAPPRDIVFVVDASLSMAGDAFEKARDVVVQSLKNVGQKDRIALVTFDAVVRSGSALEPATDVVKARLEGELRAIRASGASNLDAAVDRAHALLAESAHPVLVLATDGQPTVGEELDTLTPATKPAEFASSQVFVALFNYPSRQKPLEALFPAVTSVYVPSGAAADAAVHKLAQLATADTMRDLHIVVEGAEEATQHGRVPAQLAMGDGVRIAFRAKGAVTVRVTGTLHGAPMTLTKHVDVGALAQTRVVDGAPMDPLPMEWARLRIADLETTYREGHDENVKREITALGTTFHLVSSMTSLVATSDSLSPDHIMPGDPEIRVKAPKSADSVRAVLPWGEIVACEWLDDEKVWFGRFLVPRSIGDGLYRVRVFVEAQGVTALKTTLPFVVDSRAPDLALTATREGNLVHLHATPIMIATSRGDRHARLRNDAADVKSVVVRLGETTVHLERRDGETDWNAVVPVDVAAANRSAQLIATDYARNTKTTDVALTVAR